MARGKISLACGGIHCCPSSFLFLLPDQRPCVMKNVCVYIYVSDCLEVVYELPLLPNNTAGEPFVHKLGAVGSVDWIFIIGVPAWRRLGE